MKNIFFCFLLLASFELVAQNKQPKIEITGSAGITYEGYGLTLDPHSPAFYTPRRPWNQVRFNFAPQIKIGKEFSLPLNFNFATKATNFAGPYAGIGALGHQSFLQFITNPMNNFSVNPKYKWAELLLGTQYLSYSELSTGDVGVFGAGVDLTAKGGYLFKFFTGTSQQGINQSLVPVVPGAYKRTNWMAQIGREREGKYKVVFNVAKGKDFYNSATPPPSVNAEEGFVVSLLTNAYFKKGYYIEMEEAQSLHSGNTLSGPPPPGGVKSFQPFIISNASTVKDDAATAAFGKKSTNFDIGLKGKYLGAGFYTMGYPYQQPDRLDVTVNTRFNAWKNNNGSYKMNVVASLGQRINNMSNTATRAKQFIGNLNWFTQFNEHWSLNMSYNNFGFNTSGVVSGTPSIRNVSNDIGINPTYTWRNTKMSHLLGLSYSYSKYDETTTSNPGGIVTTTSNNTHTALLTYVPTYFNRKITPDFSLLYFLNQVPSFKTQLLTVSSGLGVPLAKEKLNLRGQIQYTLGKNGVATNNNNLVASITADFAITKKINWNTFMTTNYFKYGNELGGLLIGANYLESTVRTGITYRWK